MLKSKLRFQEELIWQSEHEYMNMCPHPPYRELKIYNAAARRRAFKTKNIFIEDNSYACKYVVPEVF